MASSSTAATTTTPLPNLGLRNSCPVCEKLKNLSRCQGCNAVRYCGREHQIEHRVTHKAECNVVKKAQTAFERAEAALRATPGDILTHAGATIFEKGEGHFWGILETRPYMRARYAVVESLLKINTAIAVKTALNHILDMLRLCRGDNMGVRDLVPALYLRLGRDQECYDFVKWWATTAQGSTYDWGNLEEPYLHLKDEDVFEGLDAGQFESKYGKLSHTASLMLLKIRLVHDLKSVRDSNVVQEGGKKEMVSSIILGNTEILESSPAELTPKIQNLEEQVQTLFKVIDGINKYFWPAMLKPGRHLTVRTSMYSAGSVQEMQLHLQYCYYSWEETPGALEKIRELKGDTREEEDPDSYQEDERLKAAMRQLQRRAGQ